MTLRGHTLPFLFPGAQRKTVGQQEEVKDSAAAQPLLTIIQAVKLLLNYPFL